MPIDYSKGKIYKIVDLETDDCYVGSTCEPTLARRLAKHISCYKCFEKGKGHFVSSYTILKNGNYDIQLIEEYPCENKMQLHSREGYWIKELNCINKKIAGRSKKEFYNDNKDKIKEYNQTNKNKRKEYLEKNKEKIAIVKKQYDKQYYEKNKDKIAEKHKKYCQSKTICECGGKFTPTNKSQHEKTTKHTSFIESK